MYMEMYLGNDTQAALRVAKGLYGAATTFRVVTEGHENLIIIANETDIVRFPRTEEVWTQGKSERYVLKKLSRDAMLPTPRLLSVSEQPAYLVTSYLRGNQLTAEHFRSLPHETLEKIGRQMAKFAYRFHQTIPIEEFRSFYTPPTWSYDDYLRRVLFDQHNQNPEISALAKHYYHLWMDTQKKKEIVVHDDLHTGNLLFDDTYKLTGVLDFGATCIGSAEQDLRQAYRFGDAALEAAATTYEELSGQPFDRNIAKLWVVTQELGAYCRADSGVAHDRAAENLRFWFPELNL